MRWIGLIPFRSISLRVGAALLTWCFSTAAFSNEGAGGPIRTWKPKVGVLKNLIVEVPATAENKATETVTYKFHVTVASEEKVEGRDCWKLVFIPGDKSPPAITQRLAILVDKAYGWPRKVTPIKSTSDAKILKIGDAWIIVDGPLGVPVDFLPLVSPRRFQEGPATIDFQTNRIGNETLVELIYFIDDVAAIRIRQRWVDGDDWWRYYEKYANETLVLRARAFDAQPLEDVFANVQRPSPVPKPEPPPPPPIVKNDHPLRQDKRLYAFVQIEPKRPAVGHILRRIKEATGVEVVTSAELETHVPDLGYISPNPKGYFAWQLMEHLAKTEIKNARWEKTPTGYQLTGISTVPPGRELVTSGNPEPLLPPARSRTWLIVSAAGLVLTLTALGVVLFLRRRQMSKKTPSAAVHNKSGKKA